MPKARQPKGGQAQGIGTPRPSDILFGRGGHVNHHSANQYYLQLVSDRKDEYHNCKKVDKASIAWDIIRELREQTPSPRFLKKNYSTGLWHIVSDAEVRRKISQCLRERTAPVLPQKNKLKLAKKITMMPATKRNPPRSSRSKVPLDLESLSSTTVEASQERDSTVDEPDCQRTEEMPPLVINISSTRTLSLGLPPPSDNPELPTSETTFMEDTADEPPQIPPVAIPPRSRFGETAKGWSDFLAGSFASFTPSILDATGGTDNTAWENLMDPTKAGVPGLCNDDDSSPAGSLSSDEESVGVRFRGDRFSSIDLTGGKQPSKNIDVDEISQVQEVQEETEPISVDNLFSSDVMSLSKVLEGSRLLNFASMS